MREVYGLSSLKEFNIEVIAAKEDSIMGKQPTKINWGAYGSVTIAEAQRFVQELNEAIKFAKGGY